MVAWVSGGLVLLLVGYLLWRAVMPVAPASLSVEVAGDQVRRAAGAWYVPLEARNDGEAAAKQVRLETALEGAGGERVRVETVVDYLAGGESQRVYAVFREDPSAGRLSSEVLGYQEP